MRDYERCRFLLPQLERAVNLEAALEQIQKDATADEESSRQLVAVQCYLRHLIESCQYTWQEQTNGVSNYYALLNRLRYESSVAFVTFNYDTLIETALEVLVGCP